MNLPEARSYLEQLWRKQVTVREFAEALQKFVDQAKANGIPYEDIVSELEDIKDSIEEEIEENKDPEDEEKEEE